MLVYVGTATETGTVEFGSIDGSVSTSANPGGGVGASFMGIWEDWLQVTSSTLATGAPADLLFTMNYDFTTQCSAGTGNTVSATVAFNPGPGPQMLVGTSDCNGRFSGSPTFDLSTTVGAILTLEGQFNIGSNAAVGGTAGVDPSVGFLVDPITANVSYITGSGTNYQTPITSAPEPATLALLGLGLAGIAIAHRRNRLLH